MEHLVQRREGKRQIEERMRQVRERVQVIEEHLWQIRSTSTDKGTHSAGKRACSRYRGEQWAPSLTARSSSLHSQFGRGRFHLFP